MKKIFSFALVIALILCISSLPVSANGTIDNNPPTKNRYYTIVHENGMTEQRPVTRWSYIQTVLHGAVNGGGGYANASADVTGYYSDYKVSVSLTLQKKSSSGSWSNLKTWSGSSKYSCSVSGNYKTSGSGYYRTRTIVTVYNTNGKVMETDTLYSAKNYI